MGKRASVVICTALTTAALPVSAFSQTSANTEPLVEIVVTAQKREQRLQDVPIVVTALPEQLLEDAGVRDIRD